MKGDFTRLTFRPDKHYTSVRMQQGRLQLDSDWNEQVDIQAHLYRSQVVDLIGAESGVPTIGENKDSFKISKVTNAQGQGTDLAIDRGHCYVNGTLCELEGTLFDFTQKSTTQVTVSTLSIDGRKLKELQWVEIFEDENGHKLTNKIFQIREVNNLDLTLVLPNGVTLPPSGKMRRIITYYTQPDYPITITSDPPNKGLNFAYLDVWQRHITTIEDPGIREVALNIPDTTTRSKTVWQLKLEPLNAQLIEQIALSEQDKKDLQTRLAGLGVPDLSNPSWLPFIKEVWQRFLQKRQNHQVYMNACAKLCSSAGSTTSNGSGGYRRLENQLYRVEIHEPGKVGKAKFKWSRDNGSIVSAIEKIQLDDGIITIRKSSQDAWSSSQSGQWIEILDEESELKNSPGTLVPLINIAGTKIKFDPCRIRANSIPKQPTKVRRWDHTTTREEAISTQTEWIELEAGIKVKFYDTSEYQTGDYWLIPARSSINGINWPNNQSDREPLLVSGAVPTPLPQFQQGIHHDYFLLGAVTVSNQLLFESVQSESNLRKVFLSLAEVNGELAKKVDKAYVDGELAKKVDRSYVDGELAKKADRTYVDTELAKKVDKTYVDTELAKKADRTYVDSQLSNKASKAGNSTQNFNANALKANSLTLTSGATVTNFSTDVNLTGANDDAVPTEKAVKTYVDNHLEKKANQSGDENQDFDVKDLKADKLFAKNVLATNTTSSGFTQISSRSLKEKVTDLTSQEVTKVLGALNPVKFIYTKDKTKHFNVGFIAEDTPDLLTSSDKQAVKIMDIVAILTKAVQDQQVISGELSDTVKHQRHEIQILQEKLGELEKRNTHNSKTIASLELSKSVEEQRRELEVLQDRFRELEERYVDSPPSIAPLPNPKGEEVVWRSPRVSRHTRWTFFKKLKRFIHGLFHWNLG
jgi:uncharacterized coiled-coil protein SlyX